MKLYKKIYKIVNNTNSSINKSKSHIIKITIIKVAITIIMTTKSHMETTVKIYELHKDCKLHRISTAKPVCAIFKKSDQKKIQTGNTFCNVANEISSNCLRSEDTKR